jgi:NAD-dependent deacetylase
MGSAEELGRRWARARRPVVLTGAGLSTASGIPDFRSPGGRWERYQPIPIRDFLARRSAREEYWRYKGETWRVIRDAEPNRAHAALVAFARAGRLDLLVTQNVDGLHERSGFPSERLVNIHGTDGAVVCLGCGAREPREPVQRAWETGEAVPHCACGGPWKPATISFGQSLVPDDLDRAMQAAGCCDLFVAAGTSLVVGPINGMFDAAHRAGAFTAILTASETPYDGACQLKLEEPVEETLPAAFSASGLGR